MNVKELMPPYVHIVDDESGFFSEIKNLKNIHIAHIDGNKCSSITQLENEFVKAYRFPDYYGYNWAAFDECLNDLSWIDSDGFILCFSNFEKLLIQDEHDNLNILLKCLSNAQEEWTKGRPFDQISPDAKPFHIVIFCGKNFENKIIRKLEKFFKKNNIEVS